MKRRPPQPSPVPDVPDPPAVRTAARASLTALLFAAVAYLLCFHAAPDAPIRGGGPSAEQAADTERFLYALGSQLALDAGGRDVVLHFPNPPPHSPVEELVTCEVYYYAGYGLYPARALLGRGGRVVNDGPTLRSADVVPDVPWMHAHRVAGLIDVPIPPTGELRFQPVP